MAKETKTPKVSKPKVEKKTKTVEITGEQFKKREEVDEKDVPADAEILDEAEVTEEPKYGDSAPLHADREPELAEGYPEGHEPSSKEYDKEVLSDEDEEPRYEDEDPVHYNKEVLGEGPKHLDDDEILTEILEKELFNSCSAEESKDTFPAGVVVGECYLVKVNRFLSDRLSKYSVRLATYEGYKEIIKTGREKAHIVANELNHHNGILHQVMVF